MSRHRIKRILGVVDRRFHTSLYECGVACIENWYGSRLLNSIRRGAGFWTVRLKYGIGMRRKGALKLHVGCGTHRLDGYTNIDRRKTRATDLVCDIRRLPYPDGSAEVVESYHVVEHLPPRELAAALREWRRVLATGGRLVIECPDFDRAVSEYLEGNEARLGNIFGLQRFPGDAHLSGYNFARLEKILQEAGFESIEEQAPRDYHASDEPCLRIVCVKAGGP